MRIDKDTSNNLVRAFEFERFCINMFKGQGLNVERNPIDLQDELYSHQVDMIINDVRNNRIAVSVKYYRTGLPNKNMLKNAIVKLISDAKILKIAKAILIVSVPIDIQLKSELENKYNVKILDGNNILFLIKNDSGLFNTFSKFMNDSYEIKQGLWKEIPFEIDFELINQQKVGTEYSCFIRPISEGNVLIEELNLLSPGVEDFKSYEQLCEKILKYIFDEHLSGWVNQCQTDDELNRFDLICRIDSRNNFWNMLVSQFSSQYVLFEFKNYDDKIKQTQIYTTEKYLFKTALRNVCFLVSRVGLSENAKAATMGILRESGKLIIGISNDDLINMVTMKDNGEEPSDYMLEKLDDCLMRISK